MKVIYIIHWFGKKNAFCALCDLEALQLDTDFIAQLIVTKMGGCKLALNSRYNLQVYFNVSRDTFYYNMYVCIYFVCNTYMCVCVCNKTVF